MRRSLRAQAATPKKSSEENTLSHFISFGLLFRNRNFGLVYTGQFISFIGTMITSVALPYQIYEKTQSTLTVGLLSLFQLLPLLITALVGGVLADRYHRRKLLVISEILLSLGCLILAMNAYLGTPSIVLIFITASLMSAITGLHRPALDSIIQQVVQKKDFPEVGALSSFKFGVCMIAGPAIAGLMISAFGLVMTYILDFFSFFISLLTLFLMTNIPSPPKSEDQSTFASIKGGFRYASSRQELLGTYLVDFVAMIFGMPNALFPAMAQSLGGVKVLGMLYAAPAVGSLVISFISGWTKKIKRHGAAIAIAAVLWGIAIIGFGLANNLWLALLFLSLAGAFDTISGIFRSIIWNQTIPTNYRGRLAGIEMISYLSGPRLGDAEAGIVASMLGVTFSIVSGGALCVFGVVLCCYYLPKFWHYQSIETT